MIVPQASSPKNSPAPFSPQIDQIETLSPRPSPDSKIPDSHDSDVEPDFENEQLGRLIQMLKNPPPPPPYPPPPESETLDEEEDPDSDSAIFENSMQRQEFTHRAEKDGYLTSDEEENSPNILHLNASYHHQHCRPVMWKEVKSKKGHPSHETSKALTQEMLSRKLRKDTIVYFRQSDGDRDGALTFSEFTYFMHKSGYFSSSSSTPPCEEVKEKRSSNSSMALRSNKKNLKSNQNQSNHITESLRLLYRISGYLSHPKSKHQVNYQKQVSPPSPFPLLVSSDRLCPRIQIHHTVTFAELPLVDNIDSISLDAVVRLVECLHGAESFKDQQIKRTLQETSLRQKMNQVSSHPLLMGSSS
jgi:hypothetical protein